MSGKVIKLSELPEDIDLSTLPEDTIIELDNCDEVDDDSYWDD